MKFLSVCSGIEAASVAWAPLGWKAVAFSEIEPFPCAVLAHHFPDTPNWGDMTKFKDWPDAAIDLLCGGTPCQSFSVAGLRKGLADPRGNLMLTFGAIAARYRPRWLVWENVPGVLSSNEGRDFGSFLGLLGVLGYGFAYRVLDAQYFGVAQRRRRVFVVGCLGSWQRAAAVLLERHGVQGHPAPRREALQDSAAGAGDGTAFCVRPASHGAAWKGDGADNFVTHALTGEGFDASEDGTGRGTPLVPVLPFDTTQMTSAANRSQPKVGDPCHPLAAGAHPPAIAFDCKSSGQNGFGVGVELAGTQRAMGHAGSHTNGGGHQAVAYQGATDASTYQADASSLLRTLRDRVGAEAVAEWGSRVLDPLQSPEVLRAWLYGEGLRQQADNLRPFVEHCPLPREEGVPARSMREVWERGPDGRTSQGRGLAKQLAFELGEALPQLPHAGTFRADTMQRLRSSAEGARAVREALSAVQNLGRPTGDEAQPAQSAYQVRRLTPVECERLMGFPDGHTAITVRGKPAADGPRYKALGNSWAVPCARWIGRRIAQVDAIAAMQAAA